MMEKKHSEKQDDSYYDALIKQRIGEALRNQSKKERLDLAQLEAWVEADRQRRRAKVKRVLAIASCFIIICAGTFSFKFAFDDDAIATAGKGDNKVTESGNNAVVSPNEQDGDENVGIRTVTCRSLEDVDILKEQFPKLMEPHYIPEGYKFEKLTIEYSELMAKYSYEFTNKNNKLQITQIAGATATVFSEYNRKLQCDRGDVLIMEEDVEIIAGCKIKDGVLYVSTKDCSDDDIVSIINEID